MKIALTYNLRREESEDQSEMYRQEEVDLLERTLSSLDYMVEAVEVSGTPDEIIEKLVAAKPDLVFNTAEGSSALGVAREAYYPAIYELMGLPYTGGGPSLLQVTLDKRLSEKLLSLHGIKCPRGVLLTHENRELPEDLPYPVIVKPNYEGTSKGIHQTSIVDSAEEARELLDEMLESYHEGVLVEAYIEGRELTVPFLDQHPGRFLEIVEHKFDSGEEEYAIYDYERKQTDEGVEGICPAGIDPDIRNEILKQCESTLKAMPCHDMGRIDFRLDGEGTPWLIELNALPRLMKGASLIIAGEACGYSYEEIIHSIVQSAVRRYRIPVGRRSTQDVLSPGERRQCREYGIMIGRFPSGKWNAITDVAGVRVGHVTHVEDGVPSPREKGEKTSIRTGITAIVPGDDDLFNNHLVAGGFILNGIGEMSGLTQAIEWGWLETPILLTNTMSLGHVHNGIIRHMIDENPSLGRNVEVVIPLIAETDDAFLNDVWLNPNTAGETIRAIESASSGPVLQGSVGGGTGMISFDFAGGIGSASRKLPDEYGGYTLGALVQSNFGKMRNLTIDGSVVGRELDQLYPYDIRRGESFGSVIVVIATDAPLLSAQLNRVAKRAALGLGRAGSYAASTSGEIVFAFSTANRQSRVAKEKEPILDLRFLSDPHINYIYEAAVECTEEAVLNAMFCSSGQTGRKQRVAPALPIRTILKLRGQ
jgi:D-alanine--D-alanine ligase